MELDSYISRPSTSMEDLQSVLNEDAHLHEVELPPVDGGKDAWLFLTGCFVIEALVWGFAFAYGVFQNYYSTHEPFMNSGNIAVVGTCAMGITYILSPCTFALLLAMPQWRRWASPAGFVIICLSLSLSSFATTTTHLILSQGIGYGIGASFAYAPTILFMDEWFVRRRGLAYGIMWAGTGLSGVVLPLVLQWLLESYGHQTTLRIWSIACFLIAAPLLYFVKPRLPISRSSSVRSFDLSFLWKAKFVLFQLGNTVEALGYFLPAIYLPTFARTLGANNVLASLTVVLCNLASVFGCVMMGHLVDRYHATTCIMVCTVGATVAVLFIWGFSVSLAPLYVFCVFYGLFAGSFTSTYSAIARDVAKTNQFANPALIIGFLCTGRGIGNVVSGPLSDTLLHASLGPNAAFAYGGPYGTLIVFTGITAFFGGLSILQRPLKFL